MELEGLYSFNPKQVDLLPGVFSNVNHPRKCNHVEYREEKVQSVKEKSCSRQELQTTK